MLSARLHVSDAVKISYDFAGDLPDFAMDFSGFPACSGVLGLSDESLLSLLWGGSGGVGGSFLDTGVPGLCSGLSPLSSALSILDRSSNTKYIYLSTLVLVHWF